MVDLRACGLSLQGSIWQRILAVDLRVCGYADEISVCLLLLAGPSPRVRGVPSFLTMGEELSFGCSLRERAGLRVCQTMWGTLLSPRLRVFGHRHQPLGNQGGLIPAVGGCCRVSADDRVSLEGPSPQPAGRFHCLSAGVRSRMGYLHAWLGGGTEVRKASLADVDGSSLPVRGGLDAHVGLWRAIR